MTKREGDCFIAGYGVCIVVFIVAWLLTHGCTLAQHHAFADGFGRAENGWCTTKASDDK